MANKTCTPADTPGNGESNAALGMVAEVAEVAEVVEVEEVAQSCHRCQPLPPHSKRLFDAGL